MKNLFLFTCSSAARMGYIQSGKFCTTGPFESGNRKSSNHQTIWGILENLLPPACHWTAAARPPNVSRHIWRKIVWSLSVFYFYVYFFDLLTNLLKILHLDLQGVAFLCDNNLSSGSKLTILLEVILLVIFVAPFMLCWGCKGL